MKFILKLALGLTLSTQAFSLTPKEAQSVYSFAMNVASLSDDSKVLSVLMNEENFVKIQYLKDGLCYSQFVDYSFDGKGYPTRQELPLPPAERIMCF